MMRGELHSFVGYAGSGKTVMQRTVLINAARNACSVGYFPECADLFAKTGNSVNRFEGRLAIYPNMLYNVDMETLNRVFERHDMVVFDDIPHIVDLQKEEYVKNRLMTVVYLSEMAHRHETCVNFSVGLPAYWDDYKGLHGPFYFSAGSYRLDRHENGQYSYRIMKNRRGPWMGRSGGLRLEPNLTFSPISG